MQFDECSLFGSPILYHIQRGEGTEWNNKSKINHHVVSSSWIESVFRSIVWFSWWKKVQNWWLHESCQQVTQQNGRGNGNFETNFEANTEIKSWGGAGGDNAHVLYIDAEWNQMTWWFDLYIFHHLSSHIQHGFLSIVHNPNYDTLHHVGLLEEKKLETVCWGDFHLRKYFQ